MKLPEDFEEYLKRGVVRKISPNRPRALFLIEESQNTFDALNERLEKIGINLKNANSIIKDSHDIIIELIRAKMLLNGFNASGNFAHEAEVAYLLTLDFNKNEVMFLNELRFFRNSVTYYGKILDQNYAQNVTKFLHEIYPKLKSLLR